MDFRAAYLPNKYWHRSSILVPKHKIVLTDHFKKVEDIFFNLDERETFEIYWVEKGIAGNVRLPGEWNYAYIDGLWYHLEKLNQGEFIENGSNNNEPVFFYYLEYDDWTNDWLNNKVEVRGTVSKTGDFNLVNTHIVQVAPLIQGQNTYRTYNSEQKVYEQPKVTFWVSKQNPFFYEKTWLDPKLFTEFNALLRQFNLNQTPNRDQFNIPFLVTKGKFYSWKLALYMAFQHFTHEPLTVYDVRKTGGTINFATFKQKYDLKELYAISSKNYSVYEICETENKHVRLVDSISFSSMTDINLVNFDFTKLRGTHNQDAYKFKDLLNAYYSKYSLNNDQIKGDFFRTALGLFNDYFGHLAFGRKYVKDLPFATGKNKGAIYKNVKIKPHVPYKELVEYDDGTVFEGNIFKDKLKSGVLGWDLGTFNYVFQPGSLHQSHFLITKYKAKITDVSELAIGKFDWNGDKNKNFVQWINTIKDPGEFIRFLLEEKHAQTFFTIGRPNSSSGYPLQFKNTNNLNGNLIILDESNHKLEDENGTQVNLHHGAVMLLPCYSTNKWVLAQGFEIPGIENLNVIEEENPTEDKDENHHYTVITECGQRDNNTKWTYSYVPPATLPLNEHGHFYKWIDSFYPKSGKYGMDSWGWRFNYSVVYISVEVPTFLKEEVNNIFKENSYLENTNRYTVNKYETSTFCSFSVLSRVKGDMPFFYIANHSFHKALWDLWRSNKFGLGRPPIPAEYAEYNANIFYVPKLVFYKYHQGIRFKFQIGFANYYDTWLNANGKRPAEGNGNLYYDSKKWNMRYGTYLIQHTQTPLQVTGYADTNDRTKRWNNINAAIWAINTNGTISSNPPTAPTAYSIINSLPGTNRILNPTEFNIEKHKYAVDVTNDNLNVVKQIWDEWNNIEIPGFIYKYIDPINYGESVFRNFSMSSGSDESKLKDFAARFEHELSNATKMLQSVPFCIALTNSPYYCVVRINGLNEYEFELISTKSDIYLKEQTKTFDFVNDEQQEVNFENTVKRVNSAYEISVFGQRYPIKTRPDLSKDKIELGVTLTPITDEKQTVSSLWYMLSIKSQQDTQRLRIEVPKPLTTMHNLSAYEREDMIRKITYHASERALELQQFRNDHDRFRTDINLKQQRLDISRNREIANEVVGYTQTITGGITSGALGFMSGQPWMTAGSIISGLTGLGGQIANSVFNKQLYDLSREEQQQLAIHGAKTLEIRGQQMALKHSDAEATDKLALWNMQNNISYPVNTDALLYEAENQQFNLSDIHLIKYEPSGDQLKFLCDYYKEYGFNLIAPNQICRGIIGIKDHIQFIKITSNLHSNETIKRMIEQRALTGITLVDDKDYHADQLQTEV